MGSFSLFRWPSKPLAESALSTKAMQRQMSFTNGHDLLAQIVYSASTHYCPVHIHWMVFSTFTLRYGIASLHQLCGHDDNLVHSMYVCHHTSCIGST